MVRREILLLSIRVMLLVALIWGFGWAIGYEMFIWNKTLMQSLQKPMGFAMFLVGIISLTLLATISVYRIPKPTQSTLNPTPIYTEFRLDIPKAYKHRLIAVDRRAAERLQKMLQKYNIIPTITQEAKNIIISFLASQELTNAEELKEKGIILDYEIEGIA